MDFAFGSKRLGLRYVEAQGKTARFDFWFNEKIEFSGEYKNDTPLFLDGQELLTFYNATLYLVGIWWYSPVYRSSAAFPYERYTLLMLTLTYVCHPESLPKHQVVQCPACKGWYIDQDRTWTHLSPCIKDPSTL